MSDRETFVGRIAAHGAAALATSIAVLALVVASTATAQQAVRIQMMVSLTSDEPGAIDPKAERIAGRLKRDFRFESLRVLDEKAERLAVDGVMAVALPNGKQARVRLLSMDERGVLLAVDIEGAVRVDARAHSGHLLVFGAGSHDGGRLVVSIEPSF
jgi:hypothetical protein